MSNDPFADAIVERLSSKLGLGPEAVRAALTRPPKPEMGDYAFPCFAAAKQRKTAPPKIAQELAADAASLGLSDLFDRIQAAGPYLNFFVHRGKLVAHVANRIRAEGERYGAGDAGAGGTVIVEYSSPNIAKPFHVGHLGTTLIGSSLSKVLAFQGFRIVRINHLGDWGVQCGYQILGWQKWGKDEDLAAGGIEYLCDLYVRANKEAAGDPALEAKARELFKGLEGGDPDLRAIWQRFTDATLAELAEPYRRLGIEFDLVRGESHYHKAGFEIIEELRRKGLAEVSEGAVVVKLEDEGLPPCILLKSDDATIYATRDLAAAIDRAKVWDFRKCLYVVDMRQSVHFRQFFAVLKRMGLPWADGLVHVSFGLMRIQEGDEVLAMSTRGGQMVPLKQFLDRMVAVVGGIVRDKNPDLEESKRAAVCEAVGVGAIVFQWLSRRRNTDSVFDWRKATDTRGDSGPYLQYTHARARSILRKFGAAAPEAADESLLTDESELAVALRLRDFPASIRKAAEQYEPSMIATYLLDLSSEFSGFLDRCRVLSSDEALTRSRVVLVHAVATVLKTGLSLLGMAAPEEM